MRPKPTSATRIGACRRLEAIAKPLSVGANRFVPTRPQRELDGSFVCEEQDEPTSIWALMVRKGIEEDRRTPAHFGASPSRRACGVPPSLVDADARSGPDCAK